MAKCVKGQSSTDQHACDHDNRNEHLHGGLDYVPQDGTVHAQWPSVAKCTDNQISNDETACDHDNRDEHKHDGLSYTPHDGTVHAQLVQIDARPPVKCKSNVFANPVTCNYDDVNSKNNAALPKDEFGNTPVKVVQGGVNHQW